MYPDLSYFDPVLMLCAAPHVFALSLRQALISARYAGAGTVPQLKERRKQCIVSSRQLCDTGLRSPLAWRSFLAIALL